MHDDDSGNDQHGGWQPPEYVSPWTPASDPDDTDSGSAPRDSSAGSDRPAQGGDTMAFNNPPGYGQGGYGQGGYPPPGYPPPGYAPPGYAPPGYNQEGYQQPGYQQSGYQQPGYQQPGYGGYGQPGYGGQYPWSGYGTPPPPRSGFGKTLAYVAVAVLAAASGAGAAVALNHTSSPASSSSSPFSGQPQQVNPGNGTGNGTGNGNPFFGNGNSNNGANNNNGSTNTGTGSLNASALANQVDPGIVDITSDLKYSGDTAEGTGMILNSTGLVLTNNHVIDQATNVAATVVTTDTTYTAKVLGYDATDDVALLQLQGASGLKPVTLSDSDKVKVGEAILALGNAGGRGGLPSTAQGTVQQLNQSIQASDEGAGTTESLHGMIETNAPIEQGDSGGPLVNGSGQVIGMDTAANSSSGGFNGPTAATTGFAIPINNAISIANQIKSGSSSGKIHIGLAGFMGVNVTDASTPSKCSPTGGDGFGGNSSFTPPVKTGALVCQAYPNSPASAAGLQNYDVITSVNGNAISKASDLTALTAASHPNDQFRITYVDQNGTTHTGTATLTGWAK